MTRSGPALVTALVAAVVVVSGCAVGQDDEMVRAPKAPTASTAPTTTEGAAAVPGRIPVGTAGLDPTVPVWSQGSVLHVGDRSADVSPRRIDAFVATPGGVYFLDAKELWFTDLSVVRATGLAGVSELVADADGARIRVTTSGASGKAHGFDTRTGRPASAAAVHPVTAQQRLGRPAALALRTERYDVSPTKGPVPVRMGTGKFGVVDVEGGPLVAFDTTYDLRRPLRGVVGRSFELVSWTGPATFYGLALEGGRPVAVLGCDVQAGRCRTWGSIGDAGSLLLESGS